MGLERVIEEILAAGQEQRRTVIAEGETERQRIVSSARTEAESAMTRKLKEAEHRAALMKQQSLSSAELEAKKRLLQEQKELLAKAKTMALESLSSLNDDTMKPHLGKLSRIAAKQLSKGIIHCRKEDEKLVGAPAGFKKSSDLKGAGGILAESEDGDYRMDLTFEALLDDVWNKDLKKVHEIMFGGA